MQLKLDSDTYLKSLSYFIFIFICITAEKCLPTGLLDISECYYGFPIALSYPHFLETDPNVADSVDGMSPNRSRHETYFYVQPVSHMVLELVFNLLYLKKKEIYSIGWITCFGNGFELLLLLFIDDE